MAWVGLSLPRLSPLLMGLLASVLVAGCGYLLGKLSWFSAHGLSALTLSILVGLIVGNTLYPRIAGPCTEGVAFSKKTILRLGVMLYGLKLTFQDVAAMGLNSFVMDVLIIGSTFVIAYLAGTRLLGMNKEQSMLIGAGSAICGAAAVMATDPVAKGKAEEVSVAISTVVVFGTISLFLYPLLYQYNQVMEIIPGGDRGFGLYVGATVHEVAQVVAVGKQISPEAADMAVMAKMSRVLLLAPFLLLLAWWLAEPAHARFALHNRGKQVSGSDQQGFTSFLAQVPSFAVGFIAMVALNSTGVLPRELVQIILELDIVLLAVAMAALGLSTKFDAFRKAGTKPLLLAAILFAWLVGGGAIMASLLG